MGVGCMGDGPISADSALCGRTQEPCLLASEEGFVDPGPTLALALLEQALHLRVWRSGAHSMTWGLLFL